MNTSNDKSTIQEVRIASGSGTAMLTVGIVVSLMLNAYTLLKVSDLAGMVAKFMKDLSPILGI